MFMYVGTYTVEYDYIAKSSDELTIRKGDIITDAVRSEDGWLKGECRGMVGHFPDNFVTPLNKEKTRNRTFPSLQTGSNGNKNDTLRKRSSVNHDTASQNSTLFQVKAVYTYLPIHDDELTIKPNDVINVTRLVEEGWYEGTLNGKLGFFPSNYVARIHETKINRKDSPVKQKPVSGLSELITKEISKKTPVKARVLFDYKKTANDELTLTANDIVTILDKNLDDEGWWRGELNGHVGVFPDNYVEEIPTSMNLKYRSNTPEVGAKHSSQILSKTNSSPNYSNESHHTKPLSISDEEGKSSEFNKQRPTTLKRPATSIIRKNENGISKARGSLDETNRTQSADVKNEHKVHTPSPPSSQRELGQLESPRYTNRSFSLSNTNNSTLNGTTELASSSHNNNNNNITTPEQLQKDLLKLKSSMDDMKVKFTDQIQDLTNELDEEKKARVTLQIELERLQKLLHKSSFVN